MTGVDILATLWRTYAPLIEIVDATSVRAGRFPDGIALPALLLRTVSSIDRQTLKAAGMVRMTDRVAATVRAASYRDQVQVMRAIRLFRVDHLPAIEIGGVTARRITILPAGKGPDVPGPANSFEQAADFRVSFDHPA